MLAADGTLHTEDNCGQKVVLNPEINIIPFIKRDRSKSREIYQGLYDLRSIGFYKTFSQPAS